MQWNVRRDILKMVTAFVTEISCNKKSPPETLFNCSEEPGNVIESVDGDDSDRMKEEHASFILAVEPRSLQ